MALQTRSKFAFELGGGVDLSYSFRSTFKRVYESLPQFGMVIPERIQEPPYALQQVARIEPAAARGCALSVPAHCTRNSAPTHCPTEADSIRSCFTGHGSERRSLESRYNLPPDRSTGLLPTPQATCHARSLGEGLAGCTSSSSDSNRSGIEFVGKGFHASILWAILRLGGSHQADGRSRSERRDSPCRECCAVTSWAQQNVQISVDDSAQPCRRGGNTSNKP